MCLDRTPGAANSYGQLGNLAKEQRDFQTAKAWYLKSLAISERLGDEHTAAITYHQLGMVAQEQRDFPTAEAWYRKSLAIFEKPGNEHGAAQSYAMLGLLAGQQDKLVEAAEWLIKGTRGFMRTHDERSQMTLGELLRCHQRAPNNDKQAILALWDQTGLGPFPEIPDDSGLSITTHLQENAACQHSPSRSTHWTTLRPLASCAPSHVPIAPKSRVWR